MRFLLYAIYVVSAGILVTIGLQQVKFVMKKPLPEVKMEDNVVKPEPPKPVQVVDWTATWNDAKNPEKSVYVECLNVPFREWVDVILVDGKNNESHRVGSYAFYLKDKPANFILDLTNALLKLKNPPSTETKILLVDQNKCFVEAEIKVKTADLFFGQQFFGD